MKLTPKAANRLAMAWRGRNDPPPGEREIEFDDDIAGWGLRRGSSWIFQYKIGAKHRRLTFGRYPALDVHARVRLGQDPAGVKAAARVYAEETFAACAGKYLAWQRQQVRPVTYRENERHLLRNLAPLHGLRIDTLDRRTIAAQLTRLTAAIGPRQANATRSSLAKFLKWCLREGLVESNQALLTNKNAENRRDRALSDSELAEVWRALPDNDFGTITKILALTGQRKREVADLAWSEIDFDRGMICLPARRVKNHRDHAVPLSDPVLALLEAKERRYGRNLVFGARQGGFSGWSKLKRGLDAAIFAARKQADKKAKPMVPWIIHDLRRACATGMAELGVQPHIIEAVLNHVSGAKAGVAGIYNRASYEGEKRAALSLWADHVTALVAGRAATVTPLKRA
jgi:integrase